MSGRGKKEEKKFHSRDGLTERWRHAAKIPNADASDSREEGFFEGINHWETGMAEKRRKELKKLRAAKDEMTELERLRKENAALRQESNSWKQVILKLPMSIPRGGAIGRISGTLSQSAFEVSEGKERHEKKDAPSTVINIKEMEELEKIENIHVIKIETMSEIRDIENTKQLAVGKTKLVLGEIIFYNMKEVEDFLDIVKDNKTFTELDVEIQCRNDKIFKRFVSCFEQYGGLKKITIYHVGDASLNAVCLFEALKKYSTLTELSMGYLDASVSECMGVLCEILTSNSGLTNFSVSFDSISASDLRILLVVLSRHPNLETLELFMNREVDDENMKVLSAAIKANKSWAEIHLEFDAKKIGAEARQEFIDAVIANGRIEVTGLDEELQGQLQLALERDQDRATHEGSGGVVAQDTVISSPSSSKKRPREIEEGEGSQYTLLGKGSTLFSSPSLRPSMSPVATNLEQNDTGLLPAAVDLGQGYNPHSPPKKAKKQGEKEEEPANGLDLIRYCGD